jgi:hypothetical protein
MKPTVTVPAHVLQDLLVNAITMSAGGYNHATVSKQADVLQACIDEQVGDSNAVYSREPTSESFGIGDDFATALQICIVKGHHGILTEEDIAATNNVLVGHFGKKALKQ